MSATLVLLHAFPFDGAMFRDDAAALAAHMRVLTPTMRGTSVEAMADDVAALLDAEGITSPVVLGGVSMGGYVSLAFARRHPGRLGGLVLADTRAEPDTAEGRAARDAAIARVGSGDLAGFVDGMLDKLVYDARRADVRALAMAQPPSSVVDTLVALRDRPDARPELASIRVPTLVVVGEDDGITPPADARALCSAIAGARLEILPGARHLSNFDRPREFRAALVSFVGGL